MTPVFSRRKEEITNAITRWVVTICLPAILGVGCKILVAIHDFDKHLAAIEQRQDNVERVAKDNFENLQVRISSLDDDFKRHLVDHSKKVVR